MRHLITSSGISPDPTKVATRVVAFKYRTVNAKFKTMNFLVILVKMLKTEGEF